MKNKLRNLLYRLRRFYILKLARPRNKTHNSKFITHNSNKTNISILLAGDFMLDSRIEPFLERHGLMYPFRHLLPLLAEYDVRALNLETPVSDLPGKKWPDKKFNFKGAPYIAQMIKSAGFDYASLSNNHIMDFGHEVMMDTQKNLDACGVKHSGTTTPTSYLLTSNSKIAFLSFTDLPLELLPNGYDKHIETYDAAAPKKIAAARKQADIVIVSIHWGVEMETKANVRQRKIAREIINAGATVVWGHHPHVIQETEKYKDGVIFYSLGNFIFSHLTPKIKIGMLAGIHCRNGKIVQIDEYKINIDNYRVLFAPILCHCEAASGLAMTKLS